jgi:TolB protein
MKRMIVLAVATVMIAGAARITTAEQCLLSTIAFSSTRDNPTGNPFLTNEIYLIDPDGTNPRRLTDNDAGDFMAKLSPDGKRIVFDSNRARGADEPLNTSDLFLMKADGKDQVVLTRGSSATWSPDGKYIAFHRSASGLGLPINPNPGAATTDSDIFVMMVPDDDGPIDEPINITNSDGQIDDDPDWSPDGKKIVFTRHPDTDHPTARPFNYPSMEIYVLNLETGVVEQLTHNDFEERAPAWSPDGTRITFLCRIGSPDPTGVATFEICVMDANGANLVRLTLNNALDAAPSWSPDGHRILFHRNVSGQGSQLWVMNVDGTDQTQLTFPPGMNLLAAWGVVRAKCPEDN